MSPEEKKLEKLNALFELVNQDFATPDDLIKLSEALLGVITTEKERLTDTISQHDGKVSREISKTLSEISKLESRFSNLVSKLQNDTSVTLSQATQALQKEIKRLERKIPNKTDLSVIEAEIAAVKAGLNTLPTELTINNEAIRDGLELLQGDERLDSSAIKGLDELFALLNKKDTVVANAGVKLLRYLQDVNIEGITNGQTIIWNSTLNRFEPGTAGGGTGSGDMEKAVYDTNDNGIVDSSEKEMVAFINKTGATLTEGTIVYLKTSSSSAAYPEALKANAATETTSSKTIGAVYEDTANDGVGYIVTSGEVRNLDTSAYSIGDRLWLATTDGLVTTTRPTAPNHAVFIGTVTRAQNGNGRILYAIQNGYEVDELHDVSFTSPANDDFFQRKGGVWVNRTIAQVKTDLNYTKSDIGLGNVDNTSDANKPISTATQTALDAKLDDSQKGAANGLAELDAGGKVPSSQLPSFVDDVVEVANFASLPGTGETGKIYVTLDTNLTYRWSGSAYVEISASLALGETSSTAYRGDRGKIAYDHSQLISGNPHNVTKADVGLGSVPNLDTTTAVSQTHARSHSMTSASDHTATAHRVFYSDASGVVTELALGASGTYLKSNGATSAPSFDTPPGGGSGISRSVAVTSGNVTAGSTAGVDYVYFVAGAHTISLPAAATNTNRYTVKNNHTAAITIDTVGTETIDGTASIQLTPEDAVDIISDGTNYFII